MLNRHPLGGPTNASSRMARSIYDSYVKVNFGRIRFSVFTKEPGAGFRAVTKPCQGGAGETSY